MYAIQTAAKSHAATSTKPVYLYRFSVDAGYNLLKKSFELVTSENRPGKKAAIILDRSNSVINSTSF